MAFLVVPHFLERARGFWVVFLFSQRHQLLQKCSTAMSEIPIKELTAHHIEGVRISTSYDHKQQFELSIRSAIQSYILCTKRITGCSMAGIDGRGDGTGWQLPFRLVLLHVHAKPL